MARKRNPLADSSKGILSVVEKKAVVDFLATGHDKETISTELSIPKASIDEVKATEDKAITKRQKEWENFYREKLEALILEVFENITLDKLKNLSPYQLVGMLALLSERRNDMVKLRLPKHDLSIHATGQTVAIAPNFQNLTLVQIDARSVELQKELTGLKELILQVGEPAPETRSLTEGSNKI